MKKDYQRIQFDFSKDALKRLDKMVDDTEAASRAELIRNALQVFEYTTKKFNEGYKLYFKKDDSENELREMLLK